MNTDFREIEEALRTIPLLDVHSHLVGGRLAARGLHDVLLYHMVVSDLYAAGCPSGARLSEYPAWATPAEARARILEALPYLKYIQNTSIFWGVRMILHDLYGWNEPITDANWEKLDGLIRERADDRAWQREVLRRANIVKGCTEMARRMTGDDDDFLHYSLEWAFFTRTVQNEYDTALIELEHTWGRPQGSPIGHGMRKRSPEGRRIRSINDVKDAMDHFIRETVKHPVLSIATYISPNIDLRPVSDTEMADALNRRDRAGIAERDIYASYLHESLLTAMAPYADRLFFLFSTAAEPLPYETYAQIPQSGLTRIVETVLRHPKIRFLCFTGSRHSNQSLCSMCRELPNLALGGYWWHTFFPSSMRQIMEERLDMLPTNRNLAFFTDAYCVEWAYGKMRLILRQLAQVLAQKIQQGQYTRDTAIAIARQILHDSTIEFTGMRP